MKREIKGGGKIRAAAPSKSHEREFAQAVEYMIEQMSSQFRNQAVKGLGQTQAKKFEDANYAVEFLTLAKRAKRKLLKRFDDDRIDTLVKTVLNKANKRNRGELYALVEKRIGISTKELTATEGMSATINALTLETSQWVKKLRDETLELYTSASLQAMTQGQSLEEVMGKLKGLEGKRRDHAKFTARNQIGNFNSITTKLRAQNLGIERAIWKTSGDERVRPCHDVRNNKEFELSEGLYSSCDGLYLLPGVDYQCRCTYELIIPED